MKTSTASEPVSAELLTPAGGASGPAVPLISSSLLLLCLGHFSVDFYSGALATLQPLLVERYSLNLSQVGTLSGVFMLGSAVCQLFFGMISDRLPSRLFVVFGLLTAGIFLSSLGLARGYGELLMLALVGGMGVAAFHPLSTSQVTVNAGVRRGLVMSIFITSGMVGLSLGPTFFSFLAQRLGLDRLSLAALPAIVVAGFLFWSLPASLNSGHQDKPPFDWEPFRRQWKPLLLQYVLVVLRSVVHLGVAQFLTIYLYTQRGFTLGQASLWLTVFFASSAVAAMIGGSIADRVGGRKVVLFSMIATVPFWVLFLATTGWPSLVGLFFGALILLLTNPVIIVMAQELVPTQAGTASALVMGFGWGMAGITFIPMIGWLADRVGLELVLWGVILLPLAGFLLALKLPDHKAQALPPALPQEIQR